MKKVGRQAPCLEDKKEMLAPFHQLQYYNHYETPASMQSCLRHVVQCNVQIDPTRFHNPLIRHESAELLSNVARRLRILASVLIISVEYWAGPVIKAGTSD